MQCLILDHSGVGQKVSYRKRTGESQATHFQLTRKTPKRELIEVESTAHQNE